MLKQMMHSFSNRLFHTKNKTQDQQNDPENDPVGSDDQLGTEQPPMETTELDSDSSPTLVSCVETMRQWTGKTHETIIYDSTVDEFTADDLFAHVKGKENIAIVTTTIDGDVFGAFYSCAVKVQEELHHDPNIFAFSFESR